MMMEGSISRRKSSATGKGPTRNSEAQGRYSEMNERESTGCTPMAFSGQSCQNATKPSCHMARERGLLNFR